MGINKCQFFGIVDQHVKPIIADFPMIREIVYARRGMNNVHVISVPKMYARAAFGRYRLRTMKFEGICGLTVSIPKPLWTDQIWSVSRRPRGGGPQFGTLHLINN